LPTIASQRASTRLAFQSGLQASTRRVLLIHSGVTFSCLQRGLHPWNVETRRAFFGRHQDPLYLDSSATTTSLFLARGRSEGRSKKAAYSSSTPISMPRGVKKENLPSKICVTCGRPFTWRKKWEKVWDEVTTCSKSCNHKRRAAKRGGGQQDVDDDTEHRSDDDDDDDERSYNSREQGSGGISKSNKKRQERRYVKTDMEYVSAELAGTITASKAASSDEESNDVNVFTAVGAHDGSVQLEDAVARQKAERKAAKKSQKAERRAQREGRGDPTAGRKDCDMCSKSVDLLIRCMYTEGQTTWSMVCGKCWKIASGGVVDGDESHPHYRYGGLWKNRRALQGS
jgi:hypothetical protein